MENTSEIKKQMNLFDVESYKFPTTRYQGSKAKLADWIWDNISMLEFETFLDSFGGTGSIAYKAKLAGKSVIYNDILKFNYYFGLGLIENSKIRLSEEDLSWILTKHSDIQYIPFIEETFRDIYFTDEENRWLDMVTANIYQFNNLYKFSLAFFALSQACIIKRPYNLFHRKNLYMRFKNVKRSFGNKTTWDRPFDEWFLNFVEEANNAIFDNNKENLSLNLNAVNVPGRYDLVYIDTPYISRKGVGVNYRNFYHFLEGLAYYYSWEKFVDYDSKHKRMVPKYSEWSDKKAIINAFDRLFARFKNSIIVVSYRSDGIPSEEKLTSLLKKYKSDVEVLHYGNYKYVLSKNNKSKELLLIGK